MHGPEKWYPLRVLVCTECWLVQTEDFVGRKELFTDEYAYFSSYSSTWLAHSNRYVVEMIRRFSLGQNSLVAEVGANDGYLLQYVKEAGIPCYGVEPTAGTAAAARARGIPIFERFFGVELATELSGDSRQADLIVAKNVLAHVQDINDFVSGFAMLLKPLGVATFEFPHLMRLVEENQFDTIYHEHFSYLSLTTVERIFKANGLDVFDVEELPTHGGSLRVFCQRSDIAALPRSDKVDNLLTQESKVGMTEVKFYSGFQSKAERVKDDFLSFLLESKRQGKIVAAYGAAAKGNTLMNYAGIRPDLISLVVDRNPAKQGKYMAGSRIAIMKEIRLIEIKPDYVVILPWNLKDEIMSQLYYVRDWGARFVTAVPELWVS